LGRPLAVVGPGGLELPRQRFTVPWSQITAVGPRQYAERRLYLTVMLLRRTCVVWEISSVAAVHDSLHLDARQRRWLRQNATLFDRPGIGFAIALIRPDVSEIVAASRALAARAALDTRDAG